MNIHDDSQRKAIVFLIVIALIVLLFFYFKSNEAPKRKPVDQSISFSPQIRDQIKPIISDTTASKTKVPDFEKIENQRGDVYNDRELLIRKIKAIDKTADFTGNYDEGSDKADDEFLAPDKYNSSFQIIGSKKHIKEVNYTYQPNTYYPNVKDFEFGVIGKIGKMLCKTQGENFTNLYLAAVNTDPNTAFKDSTIVGDKKMIIEYETKNNTINFIVTHK